MKKFSPEMKKNLGGFTLIELLVVIAIIGLLASIVLVSLSGAKNRAKDANIVSDMDQIRKAAEIAYSSDGNYGKVVCTDNTYGIKTLCDDITKQGGTITIYPAAPTTAYCADATLVTAGKRYCVDSNLNSREYSGTAKCSATDLVCEP